MGDLPFISGVSPDRPALLDDTRTGWLSYGELAGQARDWAKRLEGPRGLVVIYAHNDATFVTAMLGAFAAGHVVAFLDPGLPAKARERLEMIYRPDRVIGPGTEIVSRPGGDGPLHPDLALLLSTSGSTGSPKLVRLAMSGLAANAEGIADVLDIGGDDVAAGHLPLHYSYGLSVLTSHLVRGARIRLTGMGMLNRGFWPAMREAAVTHMPGVPFHYQIMLRRGLARLDLPGLRTLTQAGGRLDLAARTKVHAYMDQAGGRFFVLYGQTEAGPRMTTLSHAEFPRAPLSVGCPLPGCRIEILNPGSDGCGEIVFEGPSVMLGYAGTRDDLARGDELGGRLRTRDAGYLDTEGRLTLTGRTGRVGKVYGLRLNLDEVEALANSVGDCAITQSGDAIVVHVVTTGAATTDDELRNAMTTRFRERFSLRPTSFRFRTVPELPRNARGKIDYAVLERESRDSR